MKLSKKRGIDFLTLAKKRKTTYEFTDKKVKNSDIKKILEAGRWAPSCSNSQPWHFIVIKNKNRLEELMKIANYGDFHTDPALIIVLVLKSEYFGGEHRCVKNEKLGIYESYLCTAMSAVSMVFEAQDTGIDSCLLTPEQNAVSKILKLKKGDIAPVMIGFGYEKKGAFQKKRERKELKELVSYEHYGRKKK